MIYTVNGQIKPADFGNILVHEHMGCISNDMLNVFGNKWLDKNVLCDFSAEILKNIKVKYGVGLVVDATPIDLGRDVLLIRDISEKSGVPMVVSSGLYHYPTLYTSGNTENEIASWFIKEFEEGIQGTKIKPGILKVASESDTITYDNEKRLCAMSIVQKETGLPIYVHSSHVGSLAEKQLDILLGNITASEKIIIGHTALRPETEYLEKILDRGCYICMDQCHCTNYSVDKIGQTLAELCRKGYTDRILLSNDLCIYTDFGTREITGFHLSTEEQTERFSHIFTVVYKSFIENGGSEQDWNVMFKKNPLKILDV